MSVILINEYKELLHQKYEIEQMLPFLPDGYISKKNEVSIIKEQVERCK